MMGYLIRACTEKDLDKILVLCRQHAEYEQAAYSPEGKKEKLFNALFSENKQLHCIVAEVKGIVIGYATYTFDFSTWDAQQFIYLDCLYLEDEYRNYGIGQALMNTVKEKGAEKACIHMQWQTPDFNNNAIRFYKRMGGTGKDKVRFTLALP